MVWFQILFWRRSNVTVSLVSKLEESKVQNIAQLFKLAAFNWNWILNQWNGKFIVASKIVSKQFSWCVYWVRVRLIRFADQKESWNVSSFGCVKTGWRCCCAGAGGLAGTGRIAPTGNWNHGERKHAFLKNCFKLQIQKWIWFVQIYIKRPKRKRMMWSWKKRNVCTWAVGRPAGCLLRSDLTKSWPSGLTFCQRRERFKCCSSSVSHFSRLEFIQISKRYSSLLEQLKRWRPTSVK